MTPHPPLVAILGPTAVGKTTLSLVLAERLGGEVVSADSRLFYRGMDIGTAKPTPEQRARVPHHLIDVTEVDKPWSLAVFRVAALEAIAAIHARGRLPLLVGGTGQYHTAILKGWSPPALPPDPSLRKDLEAYAAAHGSEALHRELAEIDPDSAARIDHRNVRRVIRTLEVARLTGQTASRLRSTVVPPFRTLRVGLTLPRAELYARVDARIDAMLKGGLVEEVRGLLERGLAPDLPAMSGIGYRQIVDHLQGKISLQEASQRMRRATRVLIRRQSNWFKADDPSIHWFEARPGVEARIDALIRGWLGERSSP